MSVETWGLLDKSQTDSTKIEARVTEMISEHNDDPDAHLGGGRSIEVHKTNEVLDHPAGSVPTDKFSFARTVKTWFESIDGWVDYSSGGGSATPGLGAVYIYTSPTNNGVGAISAVGSGFVGLNMSKAFYWRTTLIFSNVTNMLAYWGMGYIVDLADFNGFGFRLVSGVFEAYMGDFTNLATVEITDIDLTETHVFEIRYTVSPQVVEFYIDGVLVATFDSGYFPENDDGMCTYLIKNISGTGSAVTASDFQYEQER